MKVIFINTYSNYGKDNKMYYLGTKEFYLFGMGQFIAEEFMNRGAKISFETWRMDLRITEVMEKKIDGIYCRVFPSKKIKLIGEYSSELLTAVKAVDKDKRTVFHFMGAHRLNYHFYSFFMKKNQVVATHLGGPNPYWKYKYWGQKKSYLVYLLEKYLLLRNYNHFISICLPEIEYFKKVNKNKSHMPQFGISNMHLFNIEDKEACRNKLGLPLNKKIVLQVGRASKVRGFDWIIELLDDNFFDKDIILIFVGIDKEDEYYSEIVNRGYEVVGYSSHEVLAEYYNAADLLLYLPNEFSDLQFAGTSYVPLEALMCGTPVVATTFHHIPGREVSEVSRIPEKKSDIAPMIKEILDSDISRQRCRDIVLKYYSWEKSLADHLKIYNDTM